MPLFPVALLASLLLLGDHTTTTITPPLAHSNDETAPDRTLILLAAPTARDPYYRDRRADILDFQIKFAKAILGRDHIIILCDAPTHSELARQLPQDILLIAPMRDIWIRDYTPVYPTRPTLFRYTPTAQAGTQEDAQWVQKSFTQFAKKHGLTFAQNPVLLDGGNFVENGHTRAILTDRFLTDNSLTHPQAITLLRETLGLEQIAIIPSDPEDTLAHADGMVSFISSNTIAITRYDDAFQAKIRTELHTAFPGIELIEIESPFGEEIWDESFGTAHGIYVNATVTDRHIYVPIFGIPEDAAAIEQIRAHTPREIIPVNAARVANMGGSVRCLSTQLKGENATRLIQAAREPRPNPAKDPTP